MRATRLGPAGVRLVASRGRARCPRGRLRGRRRCAISCPDSAVPSFTQRVADELLEELGDLAGRCRRPCQALLGDRYAPICGARGWLTERPRWLTQNARRRRRLEHRHRRPLAAEPGPARRGRARLLRGASPTTRSPSWSTPPSGTASTSPSAPTFEEADRRRRAPVARRPAPSVGATPSCCGSPTRPAPRCCPTTRFQEFHGEYDWLFDEGRLIGGKPVPGVGWIFVLRSPVRGPKSRRCCAA